MIERIKSALQKCGIDAWRINESEEETAELFFVRRRLDTRRVKDVHKYEVTVFDRNIADPQGGEPRCGFTSVQVIASMDDAQLEEALRDAFYAAQFAANPAYAPADPVQAPPVEKTGPLAELPLAESAGKMAKALFAPDTHEDAFVNSAELFVHRYRYHILSSEGTGVSYTSASVKGEFVVQCKQPEDVEIYNRFSYDELDEKALSDKVAEALTFVRDRAKAQRVLKSGTYDLILSGDAVGEVLSYYQSRSSAAAVYAGYSTWKTGEDVQGETEGERLELTLRAMDPYSVEGIPMEDLPLLREGKLEAYHGPNRFCRYLNVKPTGMYRKLFCANGSAPFVGMKKSPCLWAVTFSDFQMDSMSGRFGGEIRLAYLIDGDKVIPVTGGSVNASLLEAQKNLIFSTERYTGDGYEGPYAMRLTGVSVAGAAGGR